MLTSRELQLRHSGVDEMESERSADWVDAGEEVRDESRVESGSRLTGDIDVSNNCRLAFGAVAFV